MPEPEFIEMPETFRVALHRNPLPSQDHKNDGQTNTNAKANTSTSTRNKVLDAIKSDPSIMLDELAVKTGLSKSGVRYVMGKLREDGMVIREGTRKNGRWIVL